MYRGFPWEGSLASTVCGVQDYYEEVLRLYRSQRRVRRASERRVLPATAGGGAAPRTRPPWCPPRPWAA